MREDASLLEANGHPDAREYPIATLIVEAAIVRRRLSERLADDSEMIASAISSMFGKEGGKTFARQIEQLRGSREGAERDVSENDVKKLIKTR